MRHKIGLLLIIFTLCAIGCKETPFPNLLYRTDARFSGAIAEKAMVVSAHPEATRIGVEVLKRGGNAIDAAVAVQFALAVVYPSAGNIGGGGFLVLRTKDGEIACLDYREKAPLRAVRNMYLDSAGNVIPNQSLEGHLAVGVPGTVDGMKKAHAKYGKLPWQELIQPAIDLAEKGVYFFSDVEPTKLNALQEDFKRLNTMPCAFINPQGWKAGDTLKQPDLAKTLVKIRDQGRNGFYTGDVAKSIIAEMNRGNGIISFEDLENYESVWRTAIINQYKEYRIISMPPPSSGGVALNQLLRMVENKPLALWGFHTPQTVHVMVETERRVYADRATHLGDPDFYNVPVTALLSKKYLNARMETLNMEKATPSAMVKAGEIEGMKLEETPKNKKKPEKEETTHYSIVDAYGNAVSVTTTLNGSFGSKVCVGGAGFLLNNQMDDFSVKPGVPNMYGLVGAEANAIAPAKRMLSSMTPTIVEKKGNLFMVLGSPGGSTIITSVFQTFLNVVEFQMSMQEAVNAGRFHHQWKPDTLFIEKNALSKMCIQQLTKMGHTIVEREPIGRVDAILVRPDGTLEGAGDMRGEDTALGF
ncbi:MAG TPA: gamma-glutamyltransferase [Chitinophagales bacterium]|nr:gamma-glutamyltransferase [Chitinophagales bacterium]